MEGKAYREGDGEGEDLGAFSNFLTGVDGKPRKRAPRAPRRSTGGKPFSPLQKFLIIALVFGIPGGIWFYTSGRAATVFNLTLTTNPTLEDGLVGHWTFDGPDVDWASTTAEIKDRSGNNNHDDAQGGMTSATSPTTGVMGQGMSFDGVDDEITIPLNLDGE